MLHTGFQRIAFEPGWGNMDADPTVLRLFGASLHHFSPMMLINAMVLSGVFERHPALTLVVAELGVGWLTFLLNDADSRIRPQTELFMGRQMLPEELLVLSSDFPHFEGFPDPVGYYAQMLAGLGARRRDLFMGGTMAAAYDRMNDRYRSPH